MVSYEVANLFGQLFFLFCAIIGLLVIVDTMLKRAFIPTCKSIGKSLRQMLGGSKQRIEISKYKMPIEIAHAEHKSPGKHAAL
jgi:hypothetical protein